MDRIAVSGTVDAGSIPAWSATYKGLLKCTNRSSAGKQRQPAELISEGLSSGVGTAGKQRPPAELVAKAFILGVVA